MKKIPRLLFFVIAILNFLPDLQAQTLIERPLDPNVDVYRGQYIQYNHTLEGVQGFVSENACTVSLMVNGQLGYQSIPCNFNSDFAQDIPLPLVGVESFSNTVNLEGKLVFWSCEPDSDQGTLTYVIGGNPFTFTFNILPTYPVYANNAPIPMNINGPSEICSSDPVQYCVPPSMDPEAYYHWSISGNDGSITGSNTFSLRTQSNCIEVVWDNSADDNGQVNVEVCGGSFNPLSVNILADPETLDIEGEELLCAGTGTVYTYEVDYSGNLETEWSVPYGAVITGGQGTNIITVVYNENAINGNVTFTRFLPCEEEIWEDHLGITVNPGLPFIGDIIGPTTLCSGSTATYFIPEVPGAEEYEWKLGSTPVQTSESNSFITTFSTAGTKTISVTPSNTCGDAEESASIQVQVVGSSSIASVSSAGPLASSAITGTLPMLYMNPCEELSTCFNQELEKAYFYVKLDFGDTYNYGENDVFASVNLTVTVYNSLTGFGQATTPFDVLLNIDETKPERMYRLDITNNFMSWKRYKITVNGHNINGNVQNDIRLQYGYETDWKKDVRSDSPLIEAVSASQDPDPYQTKVNFSWENLACSGEFDNYEFQLLRLRNSHEINPLAHRYVIDWNKALTFETQSSNQFIDLSVTEGSGDYIFRVRPIGNYFSGGIADDRNWGTWSLTGTITQDAVINEAPSGNYALDYIQFDEDINWIHSRSFAEAEKDNEDGVKIGEQITYNTNLLQEKLSQAISNDKDEVIASEIVYDFSGRPSLQSLAVPIAGKNSFGFEHILFADNDGSGLPYSAANFDICTALSNPEVTFTDNNPFSYYSEANPNVYVPDAEGYPFVRTLFYSDGQRVKEQGAAGDILRINASASSKTVKTYYSKASEDELLRIFGDEAPVEETVQKIITVDGNGTASGIYKNKNGNVLATFLINNGNNIHQADETDIDEMVNTTDLLVGLDKGGPFIPLTHVNVPVAVGAFAISSSTPVTITEESTLQVYYELTPSYFEDACVDICTVCDYKVSFYFYRTDNFDECSGLPTDLNNLVPSANQNEVFTVGDYCIDDPFPTLNFSIPNNPPGSYFLEMVITTNNTDSEAESYLQQGIEETVAAYDGILQDEMFGSVDGLLYDDNGVSIIIFDSYTDTYILNPDFSLSGFYETLFSQSQTPSAVERFPSTAGSLEQVEYFTYEIPALCDTKINIPNHGCYDDRSCLEEDEFGNLVDFETIFNDYWSDYYTAEGLTTDPPVFNDYDDGYESGQVQTLISNMLLEQDSEGNYIYPCERMLNCWNSIVVSHETVLAAFDQLAPDPGLGYNNTGFEDSYNLVEVFLECVGYNYKGFTTNANNLGGSVIVPGGTTPSFITHAYAYFNIHDLIDANELTLPGEIATIASDNIYYPCITSCLLQEYDEQIEEFSCILSTNPSFQDNYTNSNFYSWSWNNIGFGAGQISLEQSNHVWTAFQGCLTSMTNGLGYSLPPPDLEAFFEANAESTEACNDVCDGHIPGFTTAIENEFIYNNLFYNDNDGTTVEYLLDPIFETITGSQQLQQYLIDENYDSFLDIPAGIRYSLFGPGEEITEVPIGWQENINYPIDWNNMAWAEGMGIVRTTDDLNCLVDALLDNCLDACSPEWTDEDGPLTEIVGGQEVLTQAALNELLAFQEAMSSPFYQIKLTDPTNNSCPPTPADEPEFNIINYDNSTAFTNQAFADAYNQAHNDFILFLYEYANTPINVEVDFPLHGWSLDENPFPHAYYTLQDYTCEGEVIYWFIQFTISIDATNLNTESLPYQCSLLNNDDPEAPYSFKCLRYLNKDDLDKVTLNRSGLSYYSLDGPEVFFDDELTQFFGTALAEYCNSAPNLMELFGPNNTDPGSNAFSTKVSYLELNTSNEFILSFPPNNINEDEFTSCTSCVLPCSSANCCLLEEFRLLNGHDDWATTYPDAIPYEDYEACPACITSLCFRWLREIPEVELEETLPITCEYVGASDLLTNIYGQINVITNEAGQTFENNYLTVCADPENINDDFYYGMPQGYHHYTLYYYDRSGNLISTVPPEGVELLESPFIRQATNHRLKTNYRYNSLGQMVEQTTPDGGNTRYYYNDIGQIRYSQNAKQLALGKYAYTKYDALARPVESGQTLGDPTGFAAQFEINNNNFPYTDREEVTQTVYSTLVSGIGQQNLLNRVSYVTRLGNDNQLNTNDDVVTYYSYDVHGNVKKLSQKMPGLPMYTVGYEYDLVSGNVRQVNFQEGKVDKFYHRYSYDADNRLELVETSRNGVIWERDAKYDYYNHGPLSRLQIGEDKVQGLDYVYTLQGWLKGINHPDIDSNFDPGGDGNTGSDVASDAFGMQLNYFAGDFNRTGSHFNNNDPTSLETDPNRSLYNGNISSWTSMLDVPAVADYEYDRLTGYQYRYDELNRLVQAKFNTYASGTWTEEDDYSTYYEYDANGNLEHLKRNAFGILMDNLSYKYDANSNDEKINNKLYHFNDGPGTGIPDDLEHPGPFTPGPDINTLNNFSYDEIGNLIKDAGQNISNITWTLDGKVKTIEHSGNNALSDLEFVYDAMGNRVIKIEKTRLAGVIQDEFEWTRTFYARDASGNVMGTYEQEFFPQANNNFQEKIFLKELPIYGSARLGQEVYPTLVKNVTHYGSGGPDVEYEVGYEMQTSPPVFITGGYDDVNNIYGLLRSDVENGEFNVSQTQFSPGSFTVRRWRNSCVAVNQDDVLEFSFHVADGGRAGVRGFLVNRNGGIIPNSEQIEVHVNSQVLAAKAADNIYFLFTISPTNNPLYHIIDMKANNGLGGIKVIRGVPAINIPMSRDPKNNYTLSMAAIEDNVNGISYLFLRTFDGTDNVLMKSLIKSGSMSEPEVITSFSSADTERAPEIQVSPNGRILAVGNNKNNIYPYEGEFLLFDIGEKNEVGNRYSLAYDYDRGKVSSFDFTPSSTHLYHQQKSVLSGKTIFRTVRLSLINGQKDVVIDNIQSPLISDAVATRWADGNMYIYGVSTVLKKVSNPSGDNFVVDDNPLYSGTMELGGPPVLATDQVFAIGPGGNTYIRYLNRRKYELNDHLGNVRAVISDVKLSPNNPGGYLADVLTINNFYPFGMLQPGRKFDSQNYRYGFNGMEMDDELKDIVGSSYDFGERIYDPRIGRFFSVDPVNPSMRSVYSYAANNPIAFIDVDGEWPCWSCWAKKALPIVSTVLDFVPVVGTVKAIAEAAIGYSLDGEKLEPWERVAALIPGGKIASKTFKAGKQVLNLVIDNNIVSSANKVLKKIHFRVRPSQADITKDRRKAVREAWKQEKELVEETGEGTRRWTDEEIQSILTTGKVKGYKGHHIKSVKKFPEHAKDPNNIEFLTHTEHFMKHGYNWKNPTNGKKINRLKILKRKRRTIESPKF